MSYLTVDAVLQGKPLKELPVSRTQHAALCFRIVKKKPQILLVTSRTTKRWIVPKGWPIDGLAPHEVAAREAYEEAGVEGKAFKTCIGLYAYPKILDDGSALPVAVSVFPIRVKHLRRKFPEVKERRRRWFSPKKAAQRVDEPELRELIRNFDASDFT